MAKKREWDFRCPQYVDFLAGVDSNSEETFFDCSEYESPVNPKILYKSSPVPCKGLTEEDEKKLMDKMTSALSRIENTPNLKISMAREKLFPEKIDLKNGASLQPKSLMKWKTMPLISAKMRNKSVCTLDESCTDNLNKVKILRRSSSLNDLRAVRKHTCPKTPLCLKRTIKAKAKAKAVAKTTEEMELEEISKLQKQLLETLRRNEISYRKLCGQRPYVPKNPETKYVSSKGNAAKEPNTEKNTRQNSKTMNPVALKRKGTKLDSIINGALNKFATNITTDVLEKPKYKSISSSILREESEKDALADSISHERLPFFRQRSKTINPATLMKRAAKLDNIINGASKKGASNISTDVSEKRKNPSVSSSILSEEKSKAHVPKKPIKYALHSGIMFNDSMKKMTSVKSFTFDSKINAEVQNTVVHQHSKVDKFSTTKCDMDNSKENFQITGPQSGVKKLLDKGKINSSMTLRSSKNKVVGQYSENPMRGPLTENFARN